jgi:hyperosmotically inducible periplasmic protein
MDRIKHTSLVAAVILGTALAAAGCDQQHPNETTGQKVDRATDRVAAKTSEAANKTAEVLDDTALTAKVKAAILAEPGLRSLQIGVDTHDAVVTLSGSVDSPLAKDRAREVATNVGGVRNVVDNLVTKTTQSG